MAGKRRCRDWQKTDPHLRMHPAFFKLTIRLETTPIVAHGLLAGMWGFAFTFCQDGDLSRFTAPEIATAVGWDGDPNGMMEALIHAGFLSPKWAIHDWHDWGGALFSELTRDAQKKWDARELKRREQDSMSVDVPGQTGTMRDNAPEERREEKKRVKNPPTPQGEDMQFEQFWAVYPRKRNKQGAIRCWGTRKSAGTKPATMIAAARNYAAECQREGREQRVIMHGMTFLGPDLRFADYIGPARPVASDKTMVVCLDCQRECCVQTDAPTRIDDETGRVIGWRCWECDNKPPEREEPDAF